MALLISKNYLKFSMRERSYVNLVGKLGKRKEANILIYTALGIMRYLSFKLKEGYRVISVENAKRIILFSKPQLLTNQNF
jgi:hypothetical protein